MVSSNLEVKAAGGPEQNFTSDPDFEKYVTLFSDRYKKKVLSRKLSINILILEDGTNLGLQSQEHFILQSINRKQMT